MFEDGIEHSLAMNGKTGQFGLAIDGKFKGEFEFDEIELPAAGLGKVVFK
jgi:hypothetical protein